MYINGKCNSRNDSKQQKDVNGDKKKQSKIRDIIKIIQQKGGFI